METTQPPQPEIPVEDLERAERFYTRLRARLSDWLQRRTKVDERVRGYLLLLPDLFALLIRLIRDPRVDPMLRAQLFAGVAYVISPIDLVPDFLLPAGLLDDTVAVAFVLGRLTRIMGEAGDELLREHWEGEGDILAQLQRVIELSEGLLGGRIQSYLRRRFGR